MVWFLCISRQFRLCVTTAFVGRRTRRMRAKPTPLSLSFSAETIEEFIDYMEYHGYGVKWDTDRYKYITFTTPGGIKVRDNKLFDECLLKDNLELYFMMGGCYGELAGEYLDYETPEHPDWMTKTNSSGLVELMGDIFSMIKDEPGYDPPKLNEMSQAEKREIERILGRKITNTAYLTYCTREEYEQQAGIRHG